jgi:hypothetical protein
MGEGGDAPRGGGKRGARGRRCDQKATTGLIVSEGTTPTVG